MKKLSFLLITVVFPLFLHAQTILEPSRFIIDEARKMIVCNEPLATFQNSPVPIQISVSGKIYTLPQLTASLSYGVRYAATNNGNSYDLYLSDLPLLDLAVGNVADINGQDEIPGTLSLSSNPNEVYNSPMAIRTRGNSSSFFPKKSYRVQLKDGAGKNKDHSLLGLRSDKRWLLLAQWNEEIRANNAVSHNLWIDMHKVYYSNSEPEAISSIRTKYVEVFLNKSYLGLYAFAEDMDRKQLQLKKEESGVTRGELYKADDWSLSSSFAGIGVPKAAPGSESWQNWELDYPDYSDWENHYNFLKDVIQSNDDDFKNLIWSRMKIESVIDYYIFMNLMQAEDNLEKNYFLAKYDQGEPFFFVPWDLDGTWGYGPDGSRTNKYQDIKTNELFKRLIRLNPDDFKNKLATRWFNLRQNLLSENSLKGNFTSKYNSLNAILLYERENRVASDQYNNPDRSSGLAYLHNYINQRLPWLDNYFCPMLTLGNCSPTTPTCNFAIAPTSDKASYSPAASAILQANCAGSDCSTASFTWSGNGLNATGASTTITLPTAPGEYTYTLTATKAGCDSKTEQVKITVAQENPIENCDFTITASATLASPACAAQVNLSANCTGEDCTGVTYKWTGNGINLTGNDVNTSVPAGNGTFTYTLTASKAGCADKTTTTSITVTGCTVPSEPFSVCLEAEQANGNGSVSSDANASGKATRGDQNGNNQYVDYTVNGVPAAGVYQIKLRYSANANPTISVAVNGIVQNAGIQIPATYSWNIVFREETIPVTLAAGNNIVRIQSITAACRQDKICISGNANVPPTCNFAITPTSDKASYSPAASAILQANCAGSDCSAASFAWSGNGLNATGASTTITLPTAPGEYTYTITATKAGCDSKTEQVKITVAQENPIENCDFTIAASATPASPACAAPVNLSANCTGDDCNGITYKWTGNGINLTGNSVNTNAPAGNGTFTYTLTASKAGCADKTTTTSITVTGCTVPSEPFSVCLEAEQANGNGSVSSDANASGKATRGDQNGNNQYVDYAVNGVPAAGVYQIKLRYSSNANPTISVAVNGIVQNAGIQIPATYSWNIVFREETIPVTLAAGNNIVRIQSITAACRQDKICISGNANVPPTCNFAIAPTSDKASYSPAASAILQANCAGSDCSTASFAWSGNGLNATGASTTITLPTAPGEYTYTLTATKAGCDSKTEQVKITVAQENPIENCDFTIAASATPASPACAAPVNLSANCTGDDCNGITYKWTGNGINLTGNSVNTNAPAGNGTFTYTLTASKAGCADKTTTTSITVTGCTVPSEPFSVCLEAEQANGNGSVSSDANASGKATRGDQNGNNQYVDYAVNGVPAAGVYQIKLRYSANANPTISVAVNGIVQNAGIQIPATYSWNIVFREETIPVTLAAGNNIVRIQSITAACRQDKICISGNANVPPTCNFAITPTSDKASYSPAASAILQANCAGSDCSAASFTWSGNGLNATGASPTITLPTAPGEYTYTLTATKAGCDSKTEQVKITVAQENPIENCDFTIAASATPASPACAAPVNLSANCTGDDCNGITYKWTGNGINLTGNSVNTNAPAGNGTFTYTLTASKAGCADKTTTTSITVTGCTVPSEPFSVCLEAEQANGNGSVSSDANASGKATRGDQNGNNQYVDYAVNGVPAAGVYQIKLRYSANANPTISVAVNGIVQNAGIQIPATHSWNIVFREETIRVTLAAGNNIVRIQSITGPACRQDKICVSGNTPNTRMAYGYDSQELVQEENIIEPISVSPNPTSGEFTVKFYVASNKDAELIVTDILGNTLYQQPVKKDGHQDEKIQLSVGVKGLVLVQLRTRDKLETKRLVIVR